MSGSLCLRRAAVRPARDPSERERGQASENTQDRGRDRPPDAGPFDPEDVIERDRAGAETDCS
jgi:hypothetical protein